MCLCSANGSHGDWLILDDSSWVAQVCSTWSLMPHQVSLCLFMSAELGSKRKNRSGQGFWSLRLELVHVTSASFCWPKQVPAPTPESEWKETSKTQDKGKGFREAINWQHQSNLLQALVPNIMPGGQGSYLVGLMGLEDSPGFIGLRKVGE